MDIPETKTFVSHLECSMTGDKLPSDTLQNLSPKGYPLLVRYDLPSIKNHLTKEKLSTRPQTLWRYRELLPVRHTSNIISLGEVVTPLIPLPRLSRELNNTTKSKSLPPCSIFVKDESRLPTGSFKARGLAMAVSMAKELGVTTMAMPTNGNAGAALSAYASRAGMTSIVFCPDDTPPVNMNEIAFQGARLYKVNGLINDCGALVKKGKQEGKEWFDVSTLKEPYRIEGKKTMGLELAEQFDWDLPDVIFYPTGGGTGLIGMWKAFDELAAIGFLPPNSKRPRMVAVQADGCAPIVRAFERGDRHATPWVCDEAWTTDAAGIRVPVAIGDFLILDAVRESGGFAMAVSEEEIKMSWKEVATKEGLLMCPEGAATYAAYKKALREGKVGAGDKVVLFNCASGLKYPLPDGGTNLDRHKAIDYESL